VAEEAGVVALLGLQAVTPNHSSSKDSDSSSWCKELTLEEDNCNLKRVHQTLVATKGKLPMCTRVPNSLL
jgi:hypothetical protein